MLAQEFAHRKVTLWWRREGLTPFSSRPLEGHAGGPRWVQLGLCHIRANGSATFILARGTSTCSLHRKPLSRDVRPALLPSVRVPSELPRGLPACERVTVTTCGPSHPVDGKGP